MGGGTPPMRRAPASPSPSRRSRATPRPRLLKAVFFLRLITMTTAPNTVRSMKVRTKVFRDNNWLELTPTEGASTVPELGTRLCWIGSLRGICGLDCTDLEQIEVPGEPIGVIGDDGEWELIYYITPSSLLDTDEDRL